MLMNIVRTAVSPLLVFLLLLINSSCAEKKQEVAEGLKAPGVELLDAGSGRSIDTSVLKGKVVLVNFWASWCMPCREEMPSIEALHRAMPGNDKFVMITILYRDDPAAASSYMRSGGFSFPFFADNNGVSARNFGVTGVPETYLIDKKGILRKKVIGPADWNSQEAKTLIDSLLAE